MAAFMAAGIAWAPPLAAQDSIDEHQQRVNEQHAEERRMSEMATQMNEEMTELRADENRPAAYAPNSFVSFPPEAWNDWVKYQQEQHRQQVEERFGKDPAYQELLRGVWTYRRSDPRQSPQICAATFWTRNGGVSFIHMGGREEYTFLGFFGASIPQVKKPRTISIDLIQSGETQRVRALNIHFGSVKSMGMVLFNVRRPEVLLGAIEDQQDFEVKFNGEQIAYGAWHSGLKARDELKDCLLSQGYLTKR